MTSQLCALCSELRAIIQDNTTGHAKVCEIHVNEYLQYFRLCSRRNLIKRRKATKFIKNHSNIQHGIAVNLCYVI